jgi:hypothetical protein
MITRLLIAALLVLGLAAGSLAQQKPMIMKAVPGRKPLFAGAITQEPVYTDLPSSGKKCWIGDSLYFTYTFDKKPKLGTAILKVRLFDKNGTRLTNLDIRGISDMPSMKGAHDSGEVPFKLNKKGDYLLPVNVVMPGEWEVKLIFMRNEKPIYRGRFLFKV